MIKTKYIFKTLPFTTAALDRAMNEVAKLKAKDRKYLEQALVGEFESIDSIDHQYMTLADVSRVLKDLNLRK